MISKASTAAFYPTLDPAIDVLDEIRPVDVKLREIETNQRAVLLRLPESDQVKSNVRSIVAKKWEPGNLVPSRFWGQIRKVEARLGKLRQIRKIHPKD